MNMYRYRLQFSLDLLKKYPYYMSDIYGLSNIIHNKLIDPVHPEHEKYCNKYLKHVSERYDESYFIKYYPAQGLIKDENDKVYVPQGFILAKGTIGVTDDKIWNIFLYERDEILVDKNQLEKLDNIKYYEEIRKQQEVIEKKRLKREQQKLSKENTRLARNSRKQLQIKY